MLVYGKYGRKLLSRYINMLLKDTDYFIGGDVISFSYRCVGRFWIFQVFQDIEFGFVGDVLTGIDEGIVFTEGNLTLRAAISALGINNGTFSVRESGMSQFPVVVVVDFNGVVAERARGNFLNQLDFDKNRTI